MEKLVRCTCGCMPSQWEGNGCYIRYRYGKLFVEIKEDNHIRTHTTRFGGELDGDISLAEVNRITHEVFKESVVFSEIN